MRRRQLQRRLAVVVAGVDVRALSDQQLYVMLLALARRQMQWRLAVVVPKRDVGAGIQQLIDDGGASSRGGRPSRRCRKKQVNE